MFLLSESPAPTPAPEVDVDRVLPPGGSISTLEPSTTATGEPPTDVPSTAAPSAVEEEEVCAPNTWVTVHPVARNRNGVQSEWILYFVKWPVWPERIKVWRPSRSSPDVVMHLSQLRHNQKASLWLSIGLCIPASRLRSMPDFNSGHHRRGSGFYSGRGWRGCHHLVEPSWGHCWRLGGCHRRGCGKLA